MRLTNTALTNIRKRPQINRLDLFIYEPTTILSCRIPTNNTTIAKGSVVIPFTNLSTGSAYTVDRDMILCVGTSSGADDVGRIRIREFNQTGTSGTFAVSENSNIQWDGGQYLHVLNYIDVLPVYPRIIQNPDPTTVTFYKDYNIPYGVQNTILGSFINMGSHRARTLDGGSASIYWSASGTYSLTDDQLSYSWEFGGGTPSTYSGQTPGYVTYDAVGDYVTKLTVSGISGSYDQSYRYVAIRDKIGQGSNTPIVRWEMSSLDGSRGEGGYSADFRVYDNLNIKSNSIVMLTADDWYRDAHASYGGNTQNEPYMFFVGYIDKDTIRYNYKESYVEFTALSVTGIMKKSIGFSVSVESKFAPGTWYELKDLDCRRAMYHYLRWHSTVMKVADFSYIGPDYKIQFFDSDRESMFDAIDNLMRTTLIGSVASDRQGRIYAEVHPEAYANPTGTFSNPVFNVTKQDWMGEPSIDENIDNVVSYMEWGGILYKSGKSYPYLACAPGQAPSFRGGVNKQPGLALLGQDHLNVLVGNAFASANARYPLITMDMSGKYSNLDIAPIESVNVDIDATDTAKGVAIHNLYAVDGMSWTYNHKDGLLIPNIELKAIVNGYPGDKIEIPIEPTLEPPTIKPPVIPPIVVPPILPTGTFPSETSQVIWASTNYGVAYCTNFNDIKPIWIPMNEGIASGTQNNVNKIAVTPTGIVYLLVDAGTVNGKVYRAAHLGDVWELIDSSSEFDLIRGIGADQIADDTIILLRGYYVFAPVPPYDDDPPAYVSLRINNVGASGGDDFPGINRSFYSELVWINGLWNLFSTIHGVGIFGGFTYTAWYEIDRGGGRIFPSAPNIDEVWSDNSPAEQYAIGFDNGTMFSWRHPASVVTDGYKVIDHYPPPPLELVDNVNGEPLIPYGKQAMAAAPSRDGRNRVMGGFNALSVPYRKDGNGGWESMATLIPAGMSVWENAGDADSWIFGGGTNIKYTDDFGLTFYNKEGNLSPVFPLVNIVEIRKVPYNEQTVQGI